MWFISYKDSKNKDCFVNKIFENRLDAFKYINTILNKTLVSNICVNNGDVQLVNPFIKEGTQIQLYQGNILKNYGVIEDISDHLVFIRKFNGDISEFTKGKINREYIKGRLCVT